MDSAGTARHGRIEPISMRPFPSSSGSFQLKYRGTEILDDQLVSGVELICPFQALLASGQFVEFCSATMAFSLSL
jgi:hypothetical protein